MATPSSDPNGTAFTDLLSSTVIGNTESKPKINSQGQIDLFGIGQNSGEMFPLGTSTYGGDNSDANGPGGHVTFDKKQVTNVDTVSTDDYLKTLARLSQTNPSEFMAIQQGLYNSGFYGNVSPGEVGFGRWNSKTKDALVGANGALSNFIELYKSGATQMTFSEWLGQQAKLAAQDPNSPGAGGGVSTPPLQLTDPNYIQQQGNQVADQFLGHAMSGQDTSGLVSAIHGNEQDVYNAQRAGQGGTVVNKDPAAEARAFVVQNDLPEYAAHQAEGYLNVFANMFLGGQSARANTSLGDIAIGG